MLMAVSALTVLQPVTGVSDVGLLLKFVELSRGYS